MDESTEELKANMEKAFAQRVEADQRLTALADHLNSGKGTYVTAEEYAYQTGKVLSGVFREQITEEKLPEGVFTKEFVKETIEPLLKDDHKIVSTMAAVAQENINTAAGVHIRPQKADFNQDRADGFATKMDGKTMEEAGWMLESPVTNFSQSVVDETMIKNGEVLAKAGKAATIKRDAEGGCCDWCSSKAGTFEATNREAYQRHRECRCEIEMHLDGSVKRQKDWKSNQWEKMKAEIQERMDAMEEQRAHPMKMKDSTNWQGESKPITVEVFKELTEYAADKQIVLDPGFKSFDGDVELVKEFITTLNENLGGRDFVRNRKIRLCVNYMMDDEDYAITNGATVTLNGFAYRDKKQLEADYNMRRDNGWFTKGSTYLDIATHESAHVMVYLDQLRVSGVTEKVFGLVKATVSDKIAEEVSEYATKNNDELVAESYVAYKNGSNKECVLNVLRFSGILK